MEDSFENEIKRLRPNNYLENFLSPLTLNLLYEQNLQEVLDLVNVKPYPMTGLEKYGKDYACFSSIKGIGHDGVMDIIFEDCSERLDDFKSNLIKSYKSLYNVVFLVDGKPMKDGDYDYGTFTRVLKTVKNAVELFIREVNPEVLSIVSHLASSGDAQVDAKREKEAKQKMNVYTTMIIRIAAELGAKGYTYTTSTFGKNNQHSILIYKHLSKKEIKERCKTLFNKGSKIL